MFYIFWAFLNLFLAAGFLVVGYHAVKEIRIKFGLFIALFFVAATCSFISQSPEEKPEIQTQTLHFYENRSSLGFTKTKNSWFLPDSITRNYILLEESRSYIIKESPLFDIKLHIRFGTEPTSEKKIPVYAYASLEGTSIGTEWRSIFPILNVDASGKNFQYELSSTTEWKLLNLPVYSETMDIQGTLPIE